jgi:hypothetical protein
LQPLSFLQAELHREASPLELKAGILALEKPGFACMVGQSVALSRAILFLKIMFLWYKWGNHDYRHAKTMDVD